jgi:hypothetical protein
MSDTDIQPKSGIATNENRSKICGWAVFAGLVIEVALAAAYRGHATLIENWAPVFADMLVALGVYGEIHFAGRVSKAEEKLRRKSEEKVATANERASAADEKAATATENATRAMLETEKLRADNLAMEAALAPRLLQPHPLGLRLFHHASISAIIQVVPDLEARRIAQMIASMLRDVACWNKVEMQTIPDTIDGIEIRWTSEAPTQASNIRDAVESLGGILFESQIEARPLVASRWFNDGSPVPTDTIWIVVGMRPSTYFIQKRLPEWAKRMSEYMASIGGPRGEVSPPRGN